MSVDRITHAVTTASYTASGGTVLIAGFTANEVAAIGGLLLALATFLVNWYYRHKHYSLAVARADRAVEEAE